MVHIYIHHNGSLNLENEEYIGGDVRYLGGNIDPDYFSALVIKNFVTKHLGLLNVKSISCKFEEEPWRNGLIVLQDDADSVNLISRIRSENRKTLHVYVEHYDHVGIEDVGHMGLTEGDVAVEGDVAAEGELGATVDLGADGEVGDMGDLGAEGELGADGEVGAEGEFGDMGDLGIDGELDGELGSSTDESEIEEENLSEVELTDGDEPELWPTEVQENIQELTRGNTLDWFGVGPCISREVEDEPENAGSSDDVQSMDEPIESEVEEDAGYRRKYKEFHDKDIEMKRKIRFQKLLRFRDLTQFKRALKQFSIQNGFEYNYEKNDKKRVTAKCKASQCEWRIHVSETNEKGSIAIKTYRSVHNCGTHYKNRSVNPKWIASQYMELVRDTPTLSPSALIEQIRRDWMVGISKHIAYRALRVALEMINGKHADQYKYCQDYAAALMRWNPRSWAKIAKDGDFFQRMYVRLESCKVGFLAGCRPVISVDACHLKGPFGGQLFCAVAKDANDDMFPIAYAVCENECKASWTNAKHLGDDDRRRWVLISDRQKGLLDAVDQLLPHNEHRYCLKHLHANVKSNGWKGQAIKDVLFACAKSTTEEGFKRHMEEMQGLNVACHKYLEKIHPGLWSRHAFTTHAKSDVIVNNIVETFNSWVLESRDKPILTMLEIIRRMLMNRFAAKREGLKAAKFDICPRIQTKLERAKSDGRHFICRWGNGVEFEVDHHTEERRVVNMPNKSCSCGRWQLSGIPCPHAVSAIYFTRHEPEQYVDDYYRIDAYKRAYAISIGAMSGPNVWPQVTEDLILPPQIRRRPGRPRKARRRAEDEPPPPGHSVSRRGYITRCGTCGATGHNARKCHLPPRADRRIYPKKPSKKKVTNTDQGNGAETSQNGKTRRPRTRKTQTQGDGAETSRDGERRNTRSRTSNEQENQGNQPTSQHFST